MFPFFPKPYLVKILAAPTSTLDKQMPAASCQVVKPCIHHVDGILPGMMGIFHDYVSLVEGTASLFPPKAHSMISSFGCQKILTRWDVWP